MEGMDLNTVTTIINNINNLYSNLVSYTVGLIVFVGAFVPAVISFFQRKQFSQEYEDLSAKLKVELNQKVKVAEESLRKEIEQVLKDEIEKVKASLDSLRQELEKEIGVVRAGAFHVQANSCEDKPFICLSSCQWALPLYMAGDDERNVRSIIAVITATMKHLYKDDLDNDDLDVEEVLKTILDSLEKGNVNGRYEQDIREIKFQLSDARKRVKASPPSLMQK